LAPSTHLRFAAGKFPNLTAICFFNYFKFGSTQSNDTGTLVDFRVVGGDEEMGDQFREIVGMLLLIRVDTLEVLGTINKSTRL